MDDKSNKWWVLSFGHLSQTLKILFFHISPNTTNHNLINVIYSLYRFWNENEPWRPEEISPTVWQYRGWYSQFFDSLGVEPLVHDGCLGDCVLDWHTRSLELNLIDIWKLPHKGCIGGGILDWHLWSENLLLIYCNRGFFFDLKIVQSSSKFLSRHIKDVESLHCLFRVFIKETRSKVQIGPLKMCHQGRNSKM